MRLKVVATLSSAATPSSAEAKLYGLMRKWDLGEAVTPKNAVKQIFKNQAEFPADIRNIISETIKTIVTPEVSESLNHDGLSFSLGCDLSKFDPHDEVLVDFLHLLWKKLRDADKPVESRSKHVQR